MRGKILILTGVAVGYVLGARAGRERYEQIKRFTGKLWNDPRVQHQVERVEDYAKDKAPEVAEFIADNAKRVVRQVSGTAGSSSKASTSKASTARTGASKTSASKTTASKSSASRSGASKSGSTSSTSSK
ncbi:hypothetical protein FB562_2704 [Homoserinimonas aerilata]|uniref:YtxH domain-containing protein n=1 Tax=Homoserinimonas aerilata TaxID=1162970 RepID=A0A542XX14_9MICO|nr:hypothetical protein FB562_2704 [Homoserinimonas aerilata]